MIDRRSPVVIVDYGMGNLFSVESACRAVGLPAVISSNPADIDDAGGLVLPGVGAFGEAMSRLRHHGLDDAIRRAIQDAKPTLAVCLGMQLLLDRSLELGEHKGLGLVSGTVAPLRGENGPRLPKVPHIGWEAIHAVAAEGWVDTPLEAVKSGAYLYFVHSYRCDVEQSELVLSESSFGERQFVSSYRTGSVFACQFHPERSGPLGLSLYRSVFESARVAH